MFVATGMSPQAAVSVSGPCFAVTYHEKKLFVGVNGGAVDVIEDNECRRFITVAGGGTVHSIQIHNQLIYLLDGRPWSVRVYRLDGSFVQSWNHEDSCKKINKFVIINNKIYIASRSNKKIICYTLSGDRTNNDIHIEEMSDQSMTGMCVSHRRHIIMSQFMEPSLVTCIDPDTGDRRWTVPDLVYPDGITTDVSGRIIVSTGGKNKSVRLEILDADTGEAVMGTAGVLIILGYH